MVSAGRILILPQGTWDNATMYNMLDLVAYNGISWLCKRQCVGITPSVTATEYWQQFGSSAPIASTTVAGLVMPDGQTITINTTTGAIAVPTATAAALGLVKVDGTSITIDANGVISSAGGNLSNLGDVAITSLANGQVLIWNQTNQKWQNGTIAGALSALSDVTITSATDGQILVYDATEQKWKNATAQATLSNSTKPIQTKVVKDMASDVIETLSAGASQAYSAGDLIMCSNGKWYKAITDISQNQTLTAGGNIEETSQREVNTNLTQSLGGVEFKVDSVNNKGQYSIDGGSTWQNFSEGASLVWTNPDLSQSIPANTKFNIDLSSYDAVFIEYVNNISAQSPLTGGALVTKGASISQSLGGMETATVQVGRKDISVDNNGVTVGTGYSYQMAQASVNTGWGIPAKIYGIKL